MRMWGSGRRPGQSAQPISSRSTWRYWKGKRRRWLRCRLFGRSCSRRAVGSEHAAGAVEPLGPVAVVHVGNFDAATGTGGMDETVVAEIDSDMRIGVAHGFVKDQIARLKLRNGDFLAEHADGLGIVRQHQAGRLLVDIT